MVPVQRRTKEGLLVLRCAFLCLLLVFPACTPRQEGELLVDIESDRQINTDLSFPKNTRRWAFISSRYATGNPDGFDGVRVVLANPFAARLMEENQSADRGFKLAQFIHEPVFDPNGVATGKVVRVNLMVLDPERYARSGGWGYASYDGAGNEIPIDPIADCASCHVAGPKVARLPVEPTDR